jgi:hypothetical protein
MEIPAGSLRNPPTSPQAEKAAVKYADEKEWLLRQDSNQT